MDMMKQGYDGRRGGGGGTRGRSNLNDLVGVDKNHLKSAREYLDRADHEYDSAEDSDGDNEKKKEVAEEEDEAAVLDQILKDRHNTSKRPDFEVPDSSESESDDSDSDDDSSDDDAVQQKEQEVLAKRIAKRAKMQRVLAEYEYEMSQSQSQNVGGGMFDNELSMMADGPDDELMQVSSSAHIYIYIYIQRGEAIHMCERRTRRFLPLWRSRCVQKCVQKLLAFRNC